MLAIGRKQNPTHEVSLMCPDTVPYVWSKQLKAVQVQGTWPNGSGGDVFTLPHGQRRRYVRPIQRVSREQGFHATLDFSVETFGTRPDNPMVLGFFDSDRAVTNSSLTLQIGAPERVEVILTTNGRTQSFPLTVQGGLQTNRSYRIAFTYDGAAAKLQAALSDLSRESQPVARTQKVKPGTADAFDWNELGIALREATSASTSSRETYRYRLEMATFNP